MQCQGAINLAVGVFPTSNAGWDTDDVKASQLPSQKLQPPSSECTHQCATEEEWPTSDQLPSLQQQQQASQRIGSWASAVDSESDNDEKQLERCVCNLTEVAPRILELPSDHGGNTSDQLPSLQQQQQQQRIGSWASAVDSDSDNDVAFVLAAAPDPAEGPSGPANAPVQQLQHENEIPANTRRNQNRRLRRAAAQQQQQQRAPTVEQNGPDYYWAMSFQEPASAWQFQCPAAAAATAQFFAQQQQQQQQWQLHWHLQQQQQQGIISPALASSTCAGAEPVTLFCDFFYLTSKIEFTADDLASMIGSLWKLIHASKEECGNPVAAGEKKEITFLQKVRPGCHVVKTALEKGEDWSVQPLLKELFPDCCDYLQVYWNDPYLCSLLPAFVLRSSEQDVWRMMEPLLPHLRSIIHTYWAPVTIVGAKKEQELHDQSRCRVVQEVITKGVEATCKELKEATHGIVKLLRGHVEGLATNPHGNHILRRGIPLNQSFDFIGTELLGDVDFYKTAIDVFGCRVLSEYLKDVFKCERAHPRHVELMSKLLEHAIALTGTKYGHHVIEDALKHGNGDSSLHQLFEEKRQSLAQYIEDGNRNVVFVLDTAAKHVPPGFQGDLCELYDWLHKLPATQKALMATLPSDLESLPKDEKRAITDKMNFAVHLGSVFKAVLNAGSGSDSQSE